MRYSLLLAVIFVCVLCTSAQVSDRIHLFQEIHSNPQYQDVFFLPQLVAIDNVFARATETDASYSTDWGATWLSPEVSPKRLALRRSHWVSMTTGYALSFWDQYATGACSVYVYDKQFRFIRSSAPTPVLSDFFQQLYAYGDTLIAHGAGGIGVSIDQAATWRYYGTPQLENVPFQMLRSRNGNLSTFSLTEVLSSADHGLSWLPETRWPAKTKWFYEFDDSVWIASVNDGHDHVARMYTTRNAGASWTVLDTIRCTNTGRTITDAVRAYQLLWYDARDGRLTMLLGDGDVITTTDTMQTWLDRGNIGVYACGGRNVTITHDSCALVAARKGLWRIPLFTLDTAECFAKGSEFGSGLQVDDSTSFATCHTSFLKTTDAAKAWRAWYEPVDSNRLGEYPFGVYSAQISSVSASDSTDITVSIAFSQSLYNRSAHDAHWEWLSDGVLMRPEYDDLENQYVMGRRAWSVGDRLVAVTVYRNKRYLLESHNNGRTFDTLSVVPGATIRYVEQIDTTLYIVNDSLYVHRSGVWVNIGYGLPTDSLGVQRILSLVRTNSGVLLAAFRGIRYLDTAGVATDVGCGIWSSTDEGASWSRLNNVSEHDVNVMDLHVTRAGILLATMSVVSRQDPFPEFKQDDNVIMRSADNGSTWQEVMHETYGGSLLLNPLLFTETRQGTLYTSNVNGNLSRSDDDGVTWQDVPDWVSRANINDLAVDTNGVLYVATDSALIWVKSPTTGIDDDDSRYLHLAIQPNPSQFQTTISVDNLSKTPGGVQSLVVFGTLGQASVDLTARLREQSSNDRITLDLDTSKLPMGTYVVAMCVGTQTRHVVLCVTR